MPMIEKQNRLSAKADFIDYLDWNINLCYFENVKSVQQKKLIS